MLIEFLEDVTVQDREARHYPKGCIAEMSDDACQHWVSRRKAMFYFGHLLKKNREELKKLVEIDVQNFSGVAEAPKKRSKKRNKDK